MVNQRQWPDRWRSRSISTYLLILALAILVPFQIGGILLTNLGQNAIRDEIRKSAINNARYTAQVLDREISYLTNQLDELIVSTYFQEYILRQDSMNTAEYYSLLSEHRSIIRPLYLGNQLIADIVIYYRDQDKAMSAQRGYIEIPKDRYGELAQVIRKTPGPLRVENSRHFLSSMYPGSAMFGETEPAYMIQIVLSQSYISRMLNAENSEYPTFLYEQGTKRTIGQGYDGAASDIPDLLRSGDRDLHEEQEFESHSAYIISVPTDLADYSVVQIIPKDKLFRLPNRFLTAMVLFSLLGVVSLLIYDRFSKRLVKKPVVEILTAYRRVEEGDLGFTINPDQPAAGEFKLIIDGFNQMSSRLADTVVELYSKEVFAQKMELKQLQSQINPHFLYNTYFMLHRLVSQEDMETAGKLSAFLGEYFQYITRNGQDKVAFQDEWGHASSYLEIQSLRFSATLKIEIDEVPPRLRSFQVPRLILQPLLENAIDYGVKGSSDGRIEMHCADDEHWVYVDVRSQGNPVTPESLERIRQLLEHPSVQKESTALVNIQRRLQIEFGSGSGLSAAADEQGGLVITVRMKKNPHVQGNNHE